MPAHGQSPDNPELLEAIDSIFFGADFRTQPVTSGTIIRRVRVAHAHDPIHGEEWRAVEQRAAKFVNGRYKTNHELTYRRLAGDLLSVHLDVNRQHMWIADERGRGLEAVEPDIYHGWSVLKFFGEPVEIGWGADPWELEGGE